MPCSVSPLWSRQSISIGMDFMPDARATVGMAQITPNSRNVVPGKVFFSVEFRHPQEAVLEQMEQQLLAAVAEVGIQGLSAQRRTYLPVSTDTF